MVEVISNSNEIVSLIESTTEVAWPEIFGDTTIIDDEKISVSSEIIHMFANAIFRVRLLKDGIESKINNIMETFKQKKIPTLWYITPNTKPSDIGIFLEKCGVRKEFEFSGMALDLQNNLNLIQGNCVGLEVVKVITEKEFDDWIDIQVAVYMLPRQLFHNKLFKVWKEGMKTDSWGFYLGKLNNKPIAGSCIKFCTNEFLNANQVVGIFFVAVLSEVRGKGVGKDITLAPLLEAKKRGYKYSVLYATDLGYPVYVRLGFKDYFKFPCYLYQP